MRMTDIIEHKKQGLKLTKEEIEFFVRGYTKGDIPDYQAAALAMAVYFNKMDNEETADLTLAMAHSGDMLDLSDCLRGRMHGCQNERQGLGIYRRNY